MAAAYPGDTFRAMSGAGRAIRIAAIAACCGSTAHASPDTDPTAGRAVFTGATLPSTTTSIVLDPAALVLGNAAEVLYVGMTSTVDQYSIDRKNLDLTTGALSPGAQVHAVTTSPGADLAGLWHPSDALAFGFIAAHAAGASSSSADQDALRYYTLGGYQREYQAAVAISVRATGDLLFGISIESDMTFLQLRFARDTALDNGTGPGGVNSDCGGSPCGVENPDASERYEIHVRQHSPFSDGYIVNLGAMYQIAHDVWLAAAYHTPPGGATSVNNTLDGYSTIITAPRDGSTELHGGATVYISEPVTVDAELRARIASALDLHIGGRWEDLSRNLGYDVRPFGSTYATANIPEWIEQERGFQDVLAMWAGVEQVDRGETWRFGGRVGFETAALPDDRTSPITIAPNSATLDVGAQLRLGNVILQASYGLQYFPSVSVTKSEFDPRDRVTCVDGGFDYSTPACEAVRLGYAIPTAAGDYSRIEHALRLGLRYEWH